MYEFQPTTSINTLVYEGELVSSFRALAARETYYDTLAFEIPASQTKVDVASQLEPNSLIVPPAMVSVVMPWRPQQYGSTGQMRSSSCTINVAAPSYDGNAADGTTQSYTPSFARTPLSVLIAECFVGQRGSFNWKFLPGPSSGVEIQSMFVSRANTVNAYSRMGSFPKASSVAPFCANPNVNAVSYGFTFLGAEKRFKIVPLCFDTGGSYDSGDSFSLPRGIRKNIGMKLSQIRRVVGAFMGNFAAGAICANSNERIMAGIRYPYFSMARFLPSSVTGWISKYGNAELSSNMRLTLFTKGLSSAVTSSSPGPQDTGWRVYTGLPPRSYVTVHVLTSIGDDWSVSNFVNIPALYVNDTGGTFTSSQQPTA